MLSFGLTNTFIEFRAETSLDDMLKYVSMFFMLQPQGGNWSMLTRSCCKKKKKSSYSENMTLFKVSSSYSKKTASCLCSVSVSIS
ncbi:hypothetical protein LDENG_00284510 [Lucifuga dentata]|nr:hypothetical protein LDENG_00284510 [Lucifuga dentata]